MKKLITMLTIVALAVTLYAQDSTYYGIPTKLFRNITSEGGERDTSYYQATFYNFTRGQNAKAAILQCSFTIDYFDQDTVWVSREVHKRQRVNINDSIRVGGGQKKTIGDVEKAIINSADTARTKAIMRYALRKYQTGR